MDATRELARRKGTCGIRGKQLRERGRGLGVVASILALILPCGGPVPELGTSTRLNVGTFAVDRKELELGFGDYWNSAPVISDDGDVLFDKWSGYADCERLPSFDRVTYGHPASYMVELTRSPLRAVAWSYGQNFAAGRDIAQPPYPKEAELHTSRGFGSSFAARTRLDWLDARNITGILNHHPASFLVASRLTQTEGPGFPNFAGVDRIAESLQPSSVAYGADGLCYVGFYSCLHQTEVRATLEVGRYRLSPTGRLRPWARSGWHRFESDAFALSTAGPHMVGYGPKAVAIDAASGRGAALNGMTISEWLPTERKTLKRGLPHNTTMVKMGYLRGRLFLQAGDRGALKATRALPPQRTADWPAALRSVRLYVANGSGWRLVGPYYLHAMSENGRFTIAHNVQTGEWDLFDAGSPSRT